MKKRIISFILVLAMVVSLVPAMAITASADNFGIDDTVKYPIFDSSAVSATRSFARSAPENWDNFLATVNDFLALVKLPGIHVSLNDPGEMFLDLVGSYYSKFGYGMRSSITFNTAISSLNSYFEDLQNTLYVKAFGFQSIIPDFSYIGRYVVAKEDTQLVNGVSQKILRPWFCVSSTQGFWLVDGAGGFPYAVVSNPSTSTVTYGYFNKNAAVVNDTGLVSVSDLSTLSLEYPYQGQIKTKIIQSGDYYFIGHVVGSTTIVLCKTIDGVNYAIHANYERPQTPTTVTDTGFNPIIMGNYCMDFINPATGTNFYLASSVEFQNVSNNVRTSDFNIDVIGSDGTSYSLTALSYGSLSGSFKLDLQKHSMTMPANSLWYYKLPGNVADLFEVGNKQLGVPYLYGGTSPSTGFDCSGLVKYVYREAGVFNFGDINANQIYQSCQAISFNDAMPGDLVAFTNSGDLPMAEKTHIGIYAGAGMMLVAPRSGDVVKYQAVNELAGRNPSYCRVPGVNTAKRNLVVLRNSADYAAGDSFNYFTDGDDNIFNQGDTTNTQFINYGDSTVINISGGNGFTQAGDNAITLYLDDLIYDESTKTYSSYSHSGYQLSNGDNYISVEYNYTYNFYIDYTSITYIGTTADANETYNFYYALPDGRSSADLSAEDLLALNTQTDVIAYSRGSDDTSLRSLYHFNGNVNDSSYWNLQTDFRWNTGASITYLDAGQNFKGALYFDELAHSFTITLPSSLGTGDFTVEWRYYQSHTAAPQTDSYIQFGTNKVLQFDGAHYKNSSGTTIENTAVGSWNALCLMRQDGILYFFINGVPYTIGSFSAALPSDITFYFGSSQQTTKQIDELRVVNQALYSLTGYTPSAIEFDTNLALILPGNSVPVAVEFYDIHNDSQTNIFSQYNLDWWDSEHTASGFYSSSIYSYSASVSKESAHYIYLSDGSTYPVYKTSSSVSFNDYHNFTYFSSDFQYSVSSSGSRLTSSDFLGFVHSSSSTSRYGNAYYPYSSLNYCLYSSKDTQFGSKPNTPLTFSMVAADGTFDSVTFDFTDLTISNAQDRNVVFVSKEFNGYLLMLSAVRSYDTYVTYHASIVPLDNPGEFVYLELVEGDHTDLEAAFVHEVIPVDPATFTVPTLTVRTDINITEWNIGGIRPTLPTKGMVWALVESGIITSLQIYDGQGWVEVDGRIWTGERFVPLRSYNILTMNDLLDIIGNSPGYTPIYSENAFWKWLQGAWQDMISLLTEIRDRLSGDGSQDDDGGGGHWWDDDDGDSDSDTDDGGLLDLFKTVLRGLIKVGNGILGLAFDGLESLVDWIGGIGDFFGYYSADSPDSIWQVPVEVTPTP